MWISDMNQQIVLQTMSGQLTMSAGSELLLILQSAKHGTASWPNHLTYMLGCESGPVAIDTIPSWNIRCTAHQPTQVVAHALSHDAVICVAGWEVTQ